MTHGPYFYLCLCLALASCTRSTGADSSALTSADWQKRAWLDKAARAILHEHAGLSSEDEAQLLALPRDAIVDSLMQRPAFIDTVLDFNLYFLGMKVDRLGARFGYDQPVLDRSPAALVSALELSHDGDYFTLFDWKMPYLPVREFAAPFILNLALDNPTDQQKRDHLFEQALVDVQRLRQELSASVDISRPCQQLLGFERPEHFVNLLIFTGIPTSLLSFISTPQSLQLACGLYGKAPSQSADLHAELVAEMSRLEATLGKLRKLMEQPQRPFKAIGDTMRLSMVDLGLPASSAPEAFSAEIWQSLTNSSTNLNRKRAAYMLKTFFCDDLTPLNIVAPATHAGTLHASDSGCAACHYKLDPMAGFFKRRGINGVDFLETFGFYQHDDQVTREAEAYRSYLDNWRAPELSLRSWNVGYIRSSNRQDLNAYGESLEDLFRIIRTSPESKTCLSKRLAAYVLGTQQTYDGGWIGSMASTLQESTAADAPVGASSAAFKKVFKTLVLSQTFANEQVESGQCYDFAPHATPSTLPCAVASILEKNCLSCHRGEGAPAGLDLSVWLPQTDGLSFFTHKDRKTAQAVPRFETLARIKERLSSSDPKRQMPLMKPMDPVERASLYKWIESTMTEEP